MTVDGVDSLSDREPASSDSSHDSTDSTDPYLIGHRGCLVGEPENTIRSTLAAADRLGCELLHPYVEAVDRTHLRAAAEAGFTVNAWGVSDRETFRRTVDRGVDGVIVDDFRFAGGAGSDIDDAFDGT